MPVIVCADELLICMLKRVGPGSIDGVVLEINRFWVECPVKAWTQIDICIAE